MKNSIIIETGGMKGSREEIDKENLHKILSTAFNTNKIHSEYAMTELMSQSYSLKNQIFSTPAWKKILIKDFNDPMNVSRDCNVSKSIGMSLIDAGKRPDDGPPG